MVNVLQPAKPVKVTHGKPLVIPANDPVEFDCQVECRASTRAVDDQTPDWAYELDDLQGAGIVMDLAALKALSSSALAERLTGYGVARAVVRTDTFASLHGLAPYVLDQSLSHITFEVRLP